MWNMRRKLKRVYLRTVTAKGAPHQVAGGVAVGIFWGLSPLWGFQMILAFVSATILNVSRIPAIIAVHVSNPFTAAPMYLVTWKIGDLLLSPFLGAAGAVQSANIGFSWSVLLGLAGHVLFRMLLGGFVAGAFLGVIMYFVTLQAVMRFRQTIRKRREARRRRKLEAQAAKNGTVATPRAGQGPAEPTREPVEHSA